MSERYTAEHIHTFLESSVERTTLQESGFCVSLVEDDITGFAMTLIFREEADDTLPIRVIYDPDKIEIWRYVDQGHTMVCVHKLPWNAMDLPQEVLKHAVGHLIPVKTATGVSECWEDEVEGGGS